MTFDSLTSKTSGILPVADQKMHGSLSFAKCWPQYLGAMVFGLALVWAVGFLPTDIAHNAAHDTRHSFAFPCH